MAITRSTPLLKDYRQYRKVSYPSYSVTVQDTPVRLQYSKTVTGEKVANYRSLIRKGFQATGPYDLEATLPSTFVPGSISVGFIPKGPNLTGDWRREYFEGFSTSVITTPFHLAASMTRADNDALKMAHRKVGQTMTRWQGASFLAELGESIAMLRQPLKSVLNITQDYTTNLTKIRRQLRNGHITARDFARKASDFHLTWAFGLQPLVSDTRKAAKAIAQFNYEQDSPQGAQAQRRTKCVARGMSEAELDTSISAGGSGTMIGYTVTDHRTECRVQYIVKLESKLHAAFGSAGRLADICGLTASKIIPAVYQAVPYSWLFDYFTNAGDILETLGTDQSVVAWVQKSVVTRTWYTVSTKLDLAATVKSASDRDEYVTEVFGTDFGSYQCLRTSFQRYAVSGLAFPTFEVSLPTDHLGSKLANTAAVFMQRLKSMPAFPPVVNRSRRGPFIWDSYTSHP